jgi:copper chaperone CopZ
MRKIIIAMMFLTSLMMADSTIKLSIGGMTCNGCATGINEGFKDDFPKYKVHLDYDSAVMMVHSKDGSDVNIKEVQEALLGMGFKGTLLKETKLKK